MKSGATVCQHHTIQALSAMKLKIKQLSGSTTELDIEGGDTVATAKTKMAALVSAPSTEGMKLVYKGKVLEDKQTVTESTTELNIEGGDTVATAKAFKLSVATLQ